MTGLASFQQSRLPADFKFQSPLNIPEGIHVLEFRLNPKGLGSNRSKGDIGIAAHAPFFHVAITDFKITQDLPERPQVGCSLLGCADVRLTHDLQERYSRAVEVT